MATRMHEYSAEVSWTGNTGRGTSAYRAYSRDHEIRSAAAAVPIAASSDPAFLGNPARYNPEQLLVASLASCHMLWVLHLCAEAGIVVTSYSDRAIGSMAEDEDGSGHFVEVILHPRMEISDPARIGEAEALHIRAHRLCFIANSVNFPVAHRPVVTGPPL